MRLENLSLRQRLNSFFQTYYFLNIVRLSEKKLKNIGGQVKEDKCISLNITNLFIFPLFCEHTSLYNLNPIRNKKLWRFYETFQGRSTSLTFQAIYPVSLKGLFANFIKKMEMIIWTNLIEKNMLFARLM